MLTLLARRAGPRVLSTPLFAIARQPSSLLPPCLSPTSPPAFTAGYATAAKKTAAGTVQKPGAAKDARKKAVPKKTTTKSRVSTKANKPKKKAAPKKKKVAKDAKPSARRIPLSDQPPKRAPTAYNVFASDFIKQHTIPGESTKPVVSAMAATWAAFSEEQKAPYVQRAERRKIELAKLREEYFKNTDPRVIFAFNKQRAAGRRSEKRGKAVKVSIPPEFRRPAPAYIKFMSEQRGSLSTSDKTDIKAAFVARSKEISARWKAMSDTDKKPYEDAYKRDYAAYKERVAAASRTLPT